MTATDPPRRPAWRQRLAARATRPVDAASLRAWRLLFGGLLVVAVVRFAARGWIHEELVAPAHAFHHYGLGWLPRPSATGAALLFAGLGACAVLIALGRRPRAAAALFAAGFTYAHLVDVTNYLNHYHLISLLALLVAVLPIHGTTAPAWALWTLRAQVGLVYLGGGVAKLGADWLLRGEPLATWLGAHGDFPMIGGLLVEPWVAIAASWLAAGFDLTVVGFLLARRTRAGAYLAVIAFHLFTARLFHLGMFPWVMMASSTLFFAPDWPRRLAARLGLRRPLAAAAPATAAPAAAAPARLLVAFFAVQALLPLRAHLYAGDRLWHEQGFRFGWNVMLMEKSGVVEFHVREPASGRAWVVSPRDYYTPVQVAQMSTQPDLILQAAHVVAADFRARGVAAPEVRAQAFAALNGRPRARLVDPTVDLARERDGLEPKPWILPLPEESLP